MFTEGDRYVQQGDYTEALAVWQQAISELQDKYDSHGLAQVYHRIGEVRHRLNEYTQALQALHQASSYADKTSDAILQHRISASIASIHVAQGNLSLANRILERLLIDTKQAGDAALETAVLNDYGTMLATQGHLDDASSRYQQSLELARAHGYWDHQLRVLFNLATVSARFHAYNSYLGYVQQAQQLLESDDMDFARAEYMLRFSELLLSVQGDITKQQEQQITSPKEMLDKAFTFFKSTNNKIQIAYALGLLGEWSASNHDTRQARDYWMQASFYAQQSDAQEQLYRWQWQLGRLARKQNENEQALQHYRNARQVYQKLNPFFTWTQVDPNRQDDTPLVFQYELLDLLLKQSNAYKNQEKVAALLRESIDTIESLRSAELQDYFRDSCITRTQQAVAKQHQDISSATLIMYPLVLPDRIEILTRKQGQYHRFQSSITADKLRQTVIAFREKLEKRRTREYLPLAQNLYDWLVRPLAIAGELNNIDTVVLVPDLALRALPFAALHDGQQFFIEQVALTTSPALGLTDQQTYARKNISVLRAGLSEAVQGFPALVHVRTELDNIGQLFPGAILLDQQFRQQQVSEAMQQQAFTVAHLASHGEFKDNVSDSFLLTYDGRISVNDLAQVIGATRFRPQPVELLTLSACYTAAGDDRAALGLAGVTVKAGARSALAALWPINDLATSALMTEFYKQLQDQNLSKAKVLQRAQTYMIADKRYRHPGYWSPYILIGNWK